MSHLFLTKQIDGNPAKFIRFAGPDNLVIELNGVERKVTREFWYALPVHDAASSTAGDEGGRSVSNSPRTGL